MSKPARGCGDRTINLAKQATCAKKTNLLVYEKQAKEECKPQPKSYVPPISSPQIKRIKICTGAELKKMCAPPPCPCPPKPPRPTMLQRMLRVAGFGMKGLIALSTLYVTYDMGIWGDSETTGQLYKSICAEILPKLVEPAKDPKMTPACQAESDLFTNERDPYCCDKFPIDHENSMHELKQKYNRLVSGVFSAIAGVPRTMGSLSKQAYCSIFDSETCKQHSVQGGADEDECMPRD